MDIKEIERAKEKIKKDALEKINELCSISEFNDCYLNSNESGFYLYCKKDILELLGFDLKGKPVKEYQKENKKLPIKILFVGNKILIERCIK